MKLQARLLSLDFIIGLDEGASLKLEEALRLFYRHVVKIYLSKLTHRLVSDAEQKFRVVRVWKSRRVLPSCTR
jgi:hypothetical protein